VTELSYLQAVILGIVQGLTEFLPISSSGHLALVQHWMGLRPEDPVMIGFDLAVHLGTLVAVAAVFLQVILRFFKRLASESSSSFEGRRIAWKIGMLGVLALVPTGIIGLFFKDQLEQAFGSPVAIACALIFTGVLLFTTGRIARPRRGWRRFGWLRAFLIGLGQGVAIMPGVSRSGTTIAVAMMLGIKRVWAAEFSFLIAFPAILGAAMLQAKDVVEEGLAGSLAGGPVLVGTLVATISGYFALRMLLAAVRSARLHYFAWYCWALAIVVLLVSSGNRPDGSHEPSAAVAPGPSAALVSPAGSWTSI
jgi:undecaprenyl-diphosphatase